MAPHVDLPKRQLGSCPKESTHTFMLHLASCTEGGETVLLSRLKQSRASRQKRRKKRRSRRQTPLVSSETQMHISKIANVGAPATNTDIGPSTEKRLWGAAARPPPPPPIKVLATVSPYRGRLLVFPHQCPHAGLPVINAPKLFLRGELRVEYR